MKIQIDVPENVNNCLKILKVQRANDTIAETVSQILDEYFSNEKKGSSRK